MSIPVTLQFANKKIAKKNVGLFCIADFTPLSEQITHGVKRKQIRNVSIRIGKEFITEKIEFEFDDYLAQIRFPDGDSYSEVVRITPQKYLESQVMGETTLFVKIGEPVISESAAENAISLSRSRPFTVDPVLIERKNTIDSYSRVAYSREAQKLPKKITETPFQALEQRVRIDKGRLLASLSSQLNIERIIELYLGDFSYSTEIVPIPSNSSRMKIQLGDDASLLPNWDSTAQLSAHQYFVYSSSENNGKQIKLIANVPAHWVVMSSGKSVPVEIEVLNKNSKRKATALQITIPDPEFQSIILFSQLTDLSAALSILDKSVEYLRGKVVNPYAAAAAGYVLVMSPINNSDAPWADWVGNLSRYYSDFPDGNILHATLLIQRYYKYEQWFGGHGLYYPDSKRERYQLAIKLVLDAVSKGLPIYRQGLNLLASNIKILLDDAELSLNDKNSLTKSAALINWMRMRVDPKQAFTVLDISNTVL